MSEPQDVTLNPDGSIVLLSWGESGVVTEPSSGRKATGWEDGDTVDEPTVNWLSRESMRWLRAMFSRYPKASEFLYTSWFIKNGAGVWADTGINPLEAFLSDSGGTDSLVADMWLDPAESGTAMRVQVRVSKAEPATLASERDIYIHVPVDLIDPPTVSLAELTIDDVAYDAAAPEPPEGYVTVWRVRTDTTGITEQEILLQQQPTLKSVGILQLGAGELSVGGDADITGDLTVEGNVQLATGSGKTLTVAGATTLSDSLTVGGSSSFVGSATCSQAWTFNGTVAFANTVTCSAPLIAYTHAPASDWRDALRPTRKTFVGSGVVAAGGEVVKTPITTSSSASSHSLFYMPGFLVGTTSAAVAFDVEVLVRYSADGNAPTGAAGAFVRTRWMCVALRNNGSWASASNSTPDELQSGGITVAMSVVVESGQLAISITHDIGQENLGYRMAAQVECRIVQLANAA